MILPEYKRRAKKLNRYDALSVFALTILLIGHTLLLLLRPGDQSFLTTIMFSIVILLILHGGYITRLCFQTLPQGTPNQSNARTNLFFYGLRFSFFTPIIAILVLLPVIISGAFATDDMGIVASGFLLLLVFAVALLLSPIVALLVIAPVELIVRGVVALVKGDKARTGYLFIGGYIALFTVFAIIMSFAVDIDTVYPASTVPIIASLLGLPANYSVENEALLWLGRLILAVLALSLIGFARFGNKKSLEDRGIL